MKGRLFTTVHIDILKRSPGELLIFFLALLIVTLALAWAYGKIQTANQTVQTNAAKGSQLALRLREGNKLAPQLEHAIEEWQGWRTTGAYGEARLAAWRQALLQLRAKDFPTLRWRFSGNLPNELQATSHSNKHANYSQQPQSIELSFGFISPITFQTPTTAVNAFITELRRKLTNAPPFFLRSCTFRTVKTSAAGASTHGPFNDASHPDDGDASTFRQIDCSLEWLHVAMGEKQ